MFVGKGQQSFTRDLSRRGTKHGSWTTSNMTGHIGGFSQQASEERSNVWKAPSSMPNPAHREKLPHLAELCLVAVPACIT
jgi:hypothetical protein